jgi:hypothetical protein
MIVFLFNSVTNNDCYLPFNLNNRHEQREVMVFENENVTNYNLFNINRMKKIHDTIMILYDLQFTLSELCLLRKCSNAPFELSSVTFLKQINW